MHISRGVGRLSPIRKVASLYGLKAHRLSAHHSLYRANVAFRVETDKGAYLIKPFRRLQGRISRAGRWVRQLEKAGYDHMPHWLISTNGQSVVHHKQVYFYITNWIDGEQLGATEPEMEELGRVLGRLHQTSACMLNGTKGLHYTEIQMKKQLRFNRLFAMRLPLIMKQQNQSGLWFRRKGKRCLSLVHEASRLMEKKELKAVLDNERLHPSIIHGDVTRPNVILRADKLYLIDWDRARKGSIYYDLVKALSNVTYFSVPLMEALLRGYEEQRPLTQEERQLISALFRMPGEVWRAARNIVLKKSSKIFSTVESTWNDRIAAIQWLDSWAVASPESQKSDEFHIQDEPHQDPEPVQDPDITTGLNIE